MTFNGSCFAPAFLVVLTFWVDHSLVQPIQKYRTANVSSTNNYVLLTTLSISIQGGPYH